MSHPYRSQFERTGQTDDERIESITMLPPPEHLIRFFPIRGTAVETLVADTRSSIRRIMRGEDESGPSGRTGPPASSPAAPTPAPRAVAWPWQRVPAEAATPAPLLPEDRWERAKVLQWLFFEQYSHEPCIAVSRFIRKYLPPDHPRRATLDTLKASGNEALAAMERHLARLPWFGGERYSIADIALFAYTHVADEAGIDLGAYPRIERWLKHVMQTPGFVPMRND